MAKPLPSPSQLRLLLIPGETTPPNKPLNDAAGTPRESSAWPTLLPFSLPYPSAPDVMVDFFVAGQSIYEINKGCRSLGPCSALLPPEVVLSDASLLLATPIDPLLLLLPHLKQHAASSFVSLMDAVAPTKLELQIRRNLQAVAQHPAVIRRLHFFCDIRLLNGTNNVAEQEVGSARPTATAQQGTASPVAPSAAEASTAVGAEEEKRRLSAAMGETLFVRFNMDKTLAFLARRHAKLAAAIALQRGAGSSNNGENGSIGSTPADCSSNTLAFSLISAYLIAPIATALEQRLKKNGILRAAQPSGSEKICMQRPAKASSESTGVAPAEAAAASKASNSTKTGTRLKRAAGTAANANARKTQAKKRAS
ncbi:hypothetical protein, conserved [Eimeria maxima]|uniref:Uncharacterized protein n=1 Tax=Eimeria maxima TaxID=5804 RepID=U6M231_EIMMA|nr:hypothetical protein, conserved [Eimeria maxima]CDJ58051.1 hypothetical protein, conserved [Eimeria maxima]